MMLFIITALSKVVLEWLVGSEPWLGVHEHPQFRENAEMARPLSIHSDQRYMNFKEKFVDYLVFIRYKI